MHESRSTLPIPKTFLKKHWILTTLGVVVILGIAYAVFSNSDEDLVVRAEIGSIEQEVLATGQTTARSSVNLSFEVSGKVSQSNVDVGSRVTEGEILAVLDQSGLLADRRKAQANLNQALIELETVRRESSSSSSNTRDSLIDSIRNAFIKADDAIRNTADQFFDNPGEYNTVFDPSFTDGNTTFSFGISQYTKNQLSTDRIIVEDDLNILENVVSTVNQPNTNLESAFASTRDALRDVQEFLDVLATAMNSITTTNYTYETTVQGYKSDIATARTNINTALSSLISAKSSYDNAPYVVGEGNGTYDEVLTQEAKVESLRADLDLINVSLEKTILRAPIDGVVTQADAKRGEIVTSGKGLVSIISDTELRVEANISEVSIGRVKVGDETIVTFDAFPTREFRGSVVYIDPAETLVDGVPTYKVTSVFEEALSVDIKSGLTANLTVLTDRRDNVIKIPSYAVEREGGVSFVNIFISNNVTERREVETGIQGKDGFIEVISGLEDGEAVLVP